MIQAAQLLLFCVCHDILHFLQFLSSQHTFFDTLVVYHLHGLLECLQLVFRGLVYFTACVDYNLFCSVLVLVVRPFKSSGLVMGCLELENWR